MELSPLQLSFIQHFGEMGSRWGINRTIGQIYALLVISEDPLNADQLGEALGLSRSNVSMSLKELHAWNLLRPIHIAGDRKDYFTTPEDVWEIARILIEERRKREIDPTLSVLRNTLLSDSGQTLSKQDEYAMARMREMHDLIELIVTWLGEMQTLQSSRLAKLLKLGSSVNKMLDVTDKLTGRSGQ